MKQILTLYCFLILVTVSLVQAAPDAVTGRTLAEERRADNETNVVRELRTTTRVKNVVIQIKSVKFTCGFTIFHTRSKVDMSSSKFTCTPTKPSKQNALQVKLVGNNGYSFKVNIQINPNIYKSAKITAVPNLTGGTTKAPSPPTTQTKTTATASKAATKTTSTAGATIKSTTAQATIKPTTDKATIKSTTATSATNSFEIGGQAITTTNRPTRPDPTNLTCGCKCNCPNSRLNCRCSCECPAPYSGPLIKGACAPGFSRICPYQPVGCPTNMEYVCPLKIINHVHGVTTTEEYIYNTTTMSSTTSTTTPPPTKPPYIRTKITKSIKIKANTFKCSFTFTHNHTEILKSVARCSPNRPRNQKISKVKLHTEDYSFQVNMHINPTKLNVVKVISAPQMTTSTTTTSTTTTSTTTTLPPFNENACDCVADFLLLLYSFPSLDRSLGEDIHLDWSVTAEADQPKTVEGPHISQHSLPMLAQDRDMAGGCYCVQPADYYTDSTTATTATTPTTPWTPATTASTAATGVSPVDMSNTTTMAKK